MLNKQNSSVINKIRTGFPPLLFLFKSVELLYCNSTHMYCNGLMRNKDTPTERQMK